jgi:adenylate cyclase
MIISESTYKEVKESFQARELDLIAVKGKTEPVRIYQLLGEIANPLPETLVKTMEFYSEGLKFYKEKRWAEAGSKFEEALKLDSGDFPSKLYVDRCLHFQATPPPLDWDGVWIYTTK